MLRHGDPCMQRIMWWQATELKAQQTREPPTLVPSLNLRPCFCRERWKARRTSPSCAQRRREARACDGRAAQVTQCHGWVRQGQRAVEQPVAAAAEGCIFQVPTNQPTNHGGHDVVQELHHRHVSAKAGPHCSAAAQLARAVCIAGKHGARWTGNIQSEQATLGKWPRELPPSRCTKPLNLPEPSSRPIYPPPITTMLPGTCCRLSAPVEETMLQGKVGMGGGGSGPGHAAVKIV